MRAGAGGQNGWASDREIIRVEDAQQCTMAAMFCTTALIEKQKAALVNANTVASLARIL